MIDFINNTGWHQFRFALDTADNEEIDTADLEVLMHIENGIDVAFLADRDRNVLFVRDTEDSENISVGGWLGLVELTEGYRLVCSSSGRTVREMVLLDSLSDAERGGNSGISTEPMVWETVRQFRVEQGDDGVWRATYEEATPRNFVTPDRARRHAWKLASAMFKVWVDRTIDFHLGME